MDRIDLEDSERDAEDMLDDPEASDSEREDALALLDGLDRMREWEDDRKSDPYYWG